MIDRIVREEIDKVVGTLESLISERVRVQLWEAIGANLARSVGVPASWREPPRQAAWVAEAAQGPSTTGRGPGRTCSVAGCDRPYRRMGYCGSHYQAARKHDWPRPCPQGFVPPGTSGRVAGNGTATVAVPPPALPAEPADGIVDLKSLLGG